MPMDEALASPPSSRGRPHAVVDLALVKRVGDLQSELIHDFFESLRSGSAAACM
jgi:imidazoleglycerol phosphate dehydratase HisB